MAGPTLTMPPAQSQMFDIVVDAQGRLVSMTLRPEWASFFQALQQVGLAVSRSGTTALRPTDSFQERYRGMNYFDTTLGFPVWLSIASSNVWVRYDGSPV